MIGFAIPFLDGGGILFIIMAVLMQSPYVAVAPIIMAISFGLLPALTGKVGFKDMIAELEKQQKKVFDEAQARIND